jgi:hypothetical protein
VTKGLVSREGGHFLGCDRCMRNEGLWASCNNMHLELSKFCLVTYQSLSLGPFFPSGVEPQLRGDPLLKYYEKQLLWMKGRYDSRLQLVTFIKDKHSLCACLGYCVHICLCLTWVNSCMLLQISICCYSV